MPLYLNGTDGVYGVNGTNATPAVRGSDTTGNGIFYGTDTVSVATNGTTAVTVDSSQRVGIGNTAPASTLAIGASAGSGGYDGGVYLNRGAATYNFYEANDGTNSVIFGLDNTITYAKIGTVSNYPFAFISNNTERARIDSSGNLLVGTTSAISSGKLSISNGTNRAIVTAGSTGDVGVEAIRIQKFDNNSTTSQLFIRFAINNDGAGSGQINANGASAAAFGSFSDARLKENIVELPNQLANICALKPSEFDFKDGSGHQIGFIAQEMQEVYPDVVGAGDDGMLTITGWSKTEARLVKAIQELSAKLDAAEARIAALEAK
jgi:hypothetical protein